MHDQPLSLAPTDRQWIKVGADGTHYPPGDPRTDHVAVIDVATGLMYCVASLGCADDDALPQPHAQCIERCAALRLLGFDDWRLATRNEAAWIISDTHCAPAIDPGLFPRIQPDWHWTSTMLSVDHGTSSASDAWYVHFSYGAVFDSPVDFCGFALAVRRSGQ